MRQIRREVLTAPRAVALRHLALHIDELAVLGELPEDAANAQALELPDWRFLSVVRFRFRVHARSVASARQQPPLLLLTAGAESQRQAHIPSRPAHGGATGPTPLR